MIEDRVAVVVQVDGTARITRLIVLEDAVNLEFRVDGVIRKPAELQQAVIASEDCAALVSGITTERAAPEYRITVNDVDRATVIRSGVVHECALRECRLRIISDMDGGTVVKRYVSPKSAVLNKGVRVIDEHTPPIVFSPISNDQVLEGRSISAAVLIDHRENSMTVLAMNDRRWFAINIRITENREILVQGVDHYALVVLARRDIDGVACLGCYYRIVDAGVVAACCTDPDGLGLDGEGTTGQDQ